MQPFQIQNLFFILLTTSKVRDAECKMHVCAYFLQLTFPAIIFIFVATALAAHIPFKDGAVNEPHIQFTDAAVRRSPFHLQMALFTSAEIPFTNGAVPRSPFHLQLALLTSPAFRLQMAQFSVHRWRCSCKF
jgi:hypothetical protein